jgi:putative N6-adenine-specific DNA methylase
MLARIFKAKPLTLENEIFRSFSQSYELSSSVLRENKLNLFVSCLPGLESVLSSELSLLGIRHSPVPGGANLRQASVETIVKCNLFCGSASHVLLRCERAFYAPGFYEFSSKVERMPWNEYLQSDTDVKVRASCSKSKIYHSTAIEERLKVCIDKALNRSTSQSFSGPTVHMKVQLQRDVAQILINSYSSALHKRGYKFETGKAPLREDIAYSMLYAACLILHSGTIPVAYYCVFYSIFLPLSLEHQQGKV